VATEEVTELTDAEMREVKEKGDESLGDFLENFPR